MADFVNQSANQALIGVLKRYLGKLGNTKKYALSVWVENAAGSQRGPYVDRSGTIAAANESQVLSPAADRTYFFLQNRSGGAIEYQFDDGGWVLMNDGDIYEPAIVPTNAINVRGAAAGMAYTAYER